MPITASHAVVALPFIRTPLPYGAVAVGAMTPDLSSFFPTGLSCGYTHAFPSLLVTSLLLAVALSVMWRVLLRPAASALLTPVPLPVGVAMHVLWDGFTHPARFGSAPVPALADRWGRFDGTQWLQYASSTVGLLVLGIASALHLVRTAPGAMPAMPRLRNTYSGSSLLLAAVVGVTAALLMLGVPGSTRAAELFAFEAGTLAGAVMFVATAIAAGAVHVVLRGISRASSMAA
jgi:hypothetical protein